MIIGCRGGDAKTEVLRSSGGRLKFFCEKIKFPLKTSTFGYYSRIPFYTLLVGIRRMVVGCVRVPKVD